MAYRDDREALADQVEALRRQLASAQKDADAGQRLRRELEDRLAALAKARMTLAGREEAARPGGSRAPSTAATTAGTGGPPRPSPASRAASRRLPG